MLSVKAPVFPMWFNPGGVAGEGRPLGVIERDGSWVQLWFPLALPAPRVDGRFVTYELAAGVRLVVAVAAADGSGFRPIVELDTPAAAAWFRDALGDARMAGGLPGTGFEIPYRVTSSADLTLRDTDGAGFEVVSSDDEVLFWAPPSSMWDSAADTASGTGVADRVEFPHLASSAGNWAKFDSNDVSEVQAWVAEGLRSEGATFRSNVLSGTFKIEVDMGRSIGTRGQTGIRAIVTEDGRVINAFPYNAG